MDELYKRVEASFNRQGLMKTLNASLDKVQNGLVQMLVPAEEEVLTVEFKVNFLKPAATTKLIAIGKVIQSGKPLTVVREMFMTQQWKNCWQE